MGNGHNVGMMLIGMAIGLYFPALPEPLTMLNAYLGIALIVLAIALFLRGD